MRRPSYHSLAEHPRLQQVQAVLDRVPQLTDDELTALADVWTNGPAVSKARAHALSPDTVLVVDILRAFDDVAEMFCDDLLGEEEFTTLDPPVVTVALKSVRDAIAGVIAAPVLSARDARLLLSPWSQAVPTAAPGARWSAPAEHVGSLLQAAAGLTQRCHRTDRAEAFERILLGAMARDRAEHEESVDRAFRAALLSGRRRTWALLRRDAERSVGTRCRHCPQQAFDDYEVERVADVCADAACALLVADVLDRKELDRLLQPLQGLVPFPRPPLLGA